MPFVAERDGKRVLPDEASRDDYLECPACSDRMFLRSGHSTSHGVWRASHFYHRGDRSGGGGGDGGDGCDGGESTAHQIMKYVAADYYADTYPDATVEREATPDGTTRRGDVLVTYAEPSPRYGYGFVLEAQYKHKSKDIETVTADFIDAGYSVAWADLDAFDGLEADTRQPDSVSFDVKKLDVRRAWPQALASHESRLNVFKRGRSYGGVYLDGHGAVVDGVVSEDSELRLEVEPWPWDPHSVEIDVPLPPVTDAEREDLHDRWYAAARAADPIPEPDEWGASHETADDLLEPFRRGTMVPIDVPLPPVRAAERRRLYKWFTTAAERVGMRWRLRIPPVDKWGDSFRSADDLLEPVRRGRVTIELDVPLPPLTGAERDEIHTAWFYGAASNGGVTVDGDRIDYLRRLSASSADRSCFGCSDPADIYVRLDGESGFFCDECIQIAEGSVTAADASRSSDGNGGKE